jgi:GST-like protein
VRGKYRALEWLMWQKGGFGPMLGQAHHFRLYAPERVQYAYERYTNEAKRLYGVLDRRLAEAEYLAGEYSIADMAAYPWSRSHANQGVELADFPHVKRWYDAISARPAVQRGLTVLADRRKTQMTDREKATLFGAQAVKR